MTWLTRFWAFLWAPLPPTFGPAEWTLISVCLFTGVAGILVAMAPALLSPAQYERFFASAVAAGPQERALRAEFRVKVGLGITAGSLGLIIALVVRQLNTSMLATRFLSAVVVLTIVLGALYAIFYRFALHPKLLEIAHRMDVKGQVSKTDGVKAEKKGVMQSTLVRRQVNANVMPTRAILASLFAPIAFYLLFAFQSVQSGHDHVFHMVGIYTVTPFVGYIVGLMSTLGTSLPDPFLTLRMRSRMAHAAKR